MRGMLNIVVGCLAAVSAYGALITWSRHRISVASEAAKGYDRARRRSVGYQHRQSPRSIAGDEASSALYY
jgi:hypothetical protein